MGNMLSGLIQLQVTVIKKGLTECYECQPKPARKSYPGCTIRNTPSEPVHCIVWAKHLFNQLFGEYDADDEVSPDTEDPELAGEVRIRSCGWQGCKSSYFLIEIPTFLKCLQKVPTEYFLEIPKIRFLRGTAQNGS